MSTTASAPLIKAIKGALVAGIADLDEFNNFSPNPALVWWSHPMGKLEQTCAWVGDFRSRQDWKSIGDRQRETNDASFECAIWVKRGGDTAEEVENIALDLMGAVETWLRANVTAGLDLGDFPGCKHFRLAVGRFDLSGGADDKARAARIDFDVDMYARI